MLRCPRNKLEESLVRAPYFTSYFRKKIISTVRENGCFYDLVDFELYFIRAVASRDVPDLAVFGKDQSTKLFAIREMWDWTEYFEDEVEPMTNTQKNFIFAKIPLSEIVGGLFRGCLDRLNFEGVKDISFVRFNPIAFDIDEYDSIVGKIVFIAYGNALFRR